MQNHIKSFVMRRGNITDAQQHAIDTLGQQYLIPYQEKLLNYHNFMPGFDKVFLEIGFGMGDATAAIAQDNPCHLYFGVEVYNAGIGRLLLHIKERQLKNIRIIAHDAVEVLAHMLPEASLDGIHVFFPDPWPKKRHHKRRLLQKELVANLARHLKAGGYLYAVTDWAPYAEEILETLRGEPLLENRYKGYAEPQGWRPPTKFERKGKAQRHDIFEFFFTRRQ
jgi:tRNA (guanine-N7-)-methyltransferase